MAQLLQFTASGIYCPAADVYIDPWKGVERAIITHAHSDHARAGSKHYMSHHDSETIMRLRLGQNISLQTLDYNEPFSINGVRFSLHPAGHIIGSAQIRIEHRGEIWVVSGDYKRQDDGFCSAFEPVKCHTFITESTFGLPVYHWQQQQAVMQEIRSWWQQNIDEGKTSVLMGYALGKMQRLITGLQPFIGPVYAHGAIAAVNNALRDSGSDLPEIPQVKDSDKSLYRSALILAPSSAMNTPWMHKFEPYSTGYCSGWMAVRGAKNRMAVDRGFILSDHADWDELNQTTGDTGAENIYVTHGYSDTFAKWLCEKGLNAAEVRTMYGQEEDIAATEQTVA